MGLFKRWSCVDLKIQLFSLRISVLKLGKWTNTAVTVNNCHYLLQAGRKPHGPIPATTHPADIASADMPPASMSSVVMLWICSRVYTRGYISARFHRKIPAALRPSLATNVGGSIGLVCPLDVSHSCTSEPIHISSAHVAWSYVPTILSMEPRQLTENN